MALALFLAALLYASVGHGGGSAYLAVFALAGLAPETMRPAALALNVLVAAVALLRFAGSGHFAWRLFWPFALAAAPAALLGGRLTPPGAAFHALVGLALVAGAAVLAFSARRRGEDAPLRPPTLPGALAAGAALGLLAGLTGVGGGIYLSPWLVLRRHAPVRTVAGVSAAFVLVNSLAGLVGLGPRALAHLPPSFPLWAAAAFLGGLLGATLGSRRLPPPGLRLALAVVLLVAGLKALWRGVG